jgi:hypothetical protein
VFTAPIKSQIIHPQNSVRTVLDAYFGLIYRGREQHRCKSWPLKQAIIHLTAACAQHDFKRVHFINSHSHSLALSLPADRFCVCETAAVRACTPRCCLAPKMRQHETHSNGNQTLTRAHANIWTF